MTCLALIQVIPHLPVGHAHHASHQMLLVDVETFAFATLEGFGEQLEQLSCGSGACDGLVLWTGPIAGEVFR